MRPVFAEWRDKNSDSCMLNASPTTLFQKERRDEIKIVYRGTNKDEGRTTGT
jgi:hypothetical protein